MDDAGYVFGGEVAAGAVDHFAEVAGVDEEGFVAAAATREEPEAGWDLGGAEELAGQGDDAIH